MPIYLVRAFLNIGAITPLGAAPAGYAQQCPRCDNSSSEVGLHNSVTLGGVVLDMMKLWRPYDQSYFWAEPPKIMLGRKPVSTTCEQCGAPMTSHVIWADPPVKKLGQGFVFGK